MIWKVLWTIDAILTEPEFSIIFSSDDLQLAMATGFSRPCIVDVATGNVVVTLGREKHPHIGDGNWYQTLALFFLDNQYLATAGDDGIIRFWNAQSGVLVDSLTDTNTFTTALDPETASSEPRMAAHNGWIRAIALSPDQRLLASAGNDQLIKLWSIEPRALIGTFGRRTNELVGVEFTHDGNHIVAGYEDGCIRFWSIAENRLVKTCQAHDGPITSMALTRRGVATSSGFDVIKIWDVTTFELLNTIDNPGTYFINKLAAAHDADILSFACWSEVDSLRTGHVIIWDVGAERPMSIPDEWDDVPIVTCGRWWNIDAMAITPDSTVLATAVNQQIQIWDTRSGQLLTRLWEGDDRLFDRVVSLAFSRDGQQLAAGTVGVNISLWNRDDWMQVVTLRSPNDSISKLTFSADRKTLAIATDYDENIDISDLTTNTVTRLCGHTNSVQSVAYSPDGSLLATGGRDGIVVVWKNGEILTSFAVE